ncbi:hypothetical protein JCM15519_30160 [Fundidesulfovibrio butyratiphilus]
MSPIPTPQGPGHEMTLIDHLEELRTRLIRCIVAAVVGFLVCFAFAKEILEILLHPLNAVLPAKSQVIGTGLTEPLFVSMKAAFVAGIFLTSPYIFVQIWRFISPGLYEEERRLLIPVGFFTALCFVSGACFGYFIVFPFGFKFLANYASEVVTLMPNLKDYYSFALSLLLAFGVIFEMPVFIFFLARLGIVDSRGLRNKRRWAIVIIFIVAAVLTPTPDVVNQLLMACPMVALYEISIWVAHFFGKRKSPKTDENLPVPTDTPPSDTPPSDAPPADGAAESSGGGTDAASASERALPTSPEGESSASESTSPPGGEGTDDKAPKSEATKPADESRSSTSDSEDAAATPGQAPTEQPEGTDTPARPESEVPTHEPKSKP